MVLSVLAIFGATYQLAAEEVPSVTPAAQDPAPEAQAPAIPQNVPAVPDNDPTIKQSSDPDALLNAALEAMDQAALELEGEASTAKAVEDQQLAVDHLKELLAAASQSPSGKPKSSPSHKPPSSPDSSKEQSPDSSSPNSQGDGARRSDDQNSAESSENVDGPTQSDSATSAPGTRANSVWGHLPRREQEALLRSLSDNFLPEYEAQIKRYYEALAEGERVR